MPTTKYPLNKEIATFCEALLSQSGMDNLPVEVKANMLMDLYARFESWMMLSVMQALDEASYQKFEMFLAEQPDPEKPDPQLVEDFMQKNVDQYEEVLQKAMTEFAETYLGK